MANLTETSIPWDMGTIRVIDYGEVVTAEDYENGVVASGATVRLALLAFAEEAEPIYDRIMLRGGKPREDTAMIYRVT